ncbi:MAG TPA: M14-type cytosolic carboxypeptidase [Gemmataceae bacterium]|nr:M14-type cytosolic carboxypeptidase [Gemmataceae bacterium]
MRQAALAERPFRSLTVAVLCGRDSQNRDRKGADRLQDLRNSLLVLLLAVSPLAAQIAVRSNFEGGAIGKVETVSPSHVRIGVPGQADVDKRNRQASWYYFELSNALRSPVTVELTEIAGEYDYRAPAYAITKNTRPVYSYDNTNWTHFADDQISWSPEGLTIRFTPERSRVWIAHVPPYTNRHLAALLDAHRGSRFLTRETIGKTVEGREMLLLTITNPAIADTGKKVLWLMFRQHAWESGSSWVGEGAIRFLLSSDPAAVRLRDAAIWKIFPMADPDGVAAGRVRYNANGYDLNRNWDTAEPGKMPEISAQRKAVLGWVDSGRRVDFFLSLHNTESGEYLQAPVAFRDLGERALDLLKTRTTFNPTVPLRESPATADPGRMTVSQGLYHDRKIPSMLMEQMVERNSKLGYCPTVKDREDFGPALVQVLYEAIR